VNYDVKFTFDVDVYIESAEVDRLLRQGLLIAAVKLDRPAQDAESSSAQAFGSADGDTPAPRVATEVLIRDVQTQFPAGAPFWRLGLASGDCISIAIPDDGTIGEIRDGFQGMGSIVHDPEARHVCCAHPCALVSALSNGSSFLSSSSSESD
jgi:hypothetical protein